MHHKHRYPLPSLQLWRERRHLSQRTLARQAGIAVSTIARLEAGKTAAIGITVEKLVTVLGISREDLLTGSTG